jgi:hypothetical protein
MEISKRKNTKLSSKLKVKPTFKDFTKPGLAKNCLKKLNKTEKMKEIL